MNQLALYHAPETLRALLPYLPGDTWIGRVFSGLHFVFIAWPIQQVYVRWFWGGREIHDICAQLTHHSSRFWEQHPEACIDLIANNFDSWLVITQFAVYILLWITCLLHCIRKF